MTGKPSRKSVIKLSLAAITVLTPIAWDWYSKSTRLEVQQLASSTLIERSDNLQKLQFLYDGEPVSKLSQQVIAVFNAGRTPIEAGDVYVPLVIKFPKGVQIFELNIEQKYPANIEVSHYFDQKDNSLRVDFPLLNPGDWIRFGVLLDGSDAELTASARITGIKKIILVDRRDQFQGGKKKMSLIRGLLAFFILPIAFLIFIGMFFDARKEKTTLKLYSAGGLSIPTRTKKDEYLKFISSTLSFRTEPERNKLLEIFKKIPEGQNIDEAKQQEFEKMTKELLSQRLYTGSFFFVFALVIVLGMLYIWTGTFEIGPTLR